MKRHIWDGAVEVQTCVVCRIQRREIFHTLDRVHLVRGYNITQYFVNNEWTSANNSENRWCSGNQIQLPVKNNQNESIR